MPPSDRGTGSGERCPTGTEPLLPRGESSVDGWMVGTQYSTVTEFKVVGLYEKSLYYPPNFYVNIKLLKNKVY